MGTVYIDDETWQKVKDETIKGIIETKESIKEREVLKYLVEKALEDFGTEDYYEILKKKRERKG